MQKARKKERNIDDYKDMSRKVLEDILSKHPTFPSSPVQHKPTQKPASIKHKPLVQALN